MCSRRKQNLFTSYQNFFCNSRSNVRCSFLLYLIRHSIEGEGTDDREVGVHFGCDRDYRGKRWCRAAARSGQRLYLPLCWAPTARRAHAHRLMSQWGRDCASGGGERGGRGATSEQQRRRKKVDYQYTPNNDWLMIVKCESIVVGRLYRRPPLQRWIS
jgi:hypothetical protein